MITFKQYLFEKVYANQNYLFLNVPIEDYLRFNLNRYGKDFLHAADEKSYRTYKRYHSRSRASNPRDNYIYQIITPVNYLDPKSSRELDKFERLNADKISYSREYIGHDGWIGYYEMSDLYKLEPIWQGFIGQHNFRMISADWLKANLDKVKLIDGNAVRFDNNSRMGDIEMPSWVIGDLVNYTEKSGRRLRKTTVEWLRENFPKPYKRIKLYRGVGTALGHDGLWGMNEISDISQIIKPLKRRYGISKLDDFQKGKQIYLSRGKASSWSTDPQIASTFTRGIASKYINVLAVAEVPADRVLVDFNLMPKVYQKNFMFLHQNEVILDTGKIKSKISWVTIDKKFLEILRNFGYDYRAGKGIIKK